LLLSLQTPTFGKDLHKDNQQQDEPQQHAAAACVAEAAAAPPQQRHRLANISNMPRSPMHTAFKSPSREEFAFDTDARAADCSMQWTGPKQQQQTSTRQQRRRQPQVTFLSSEAPYLLSVSYGLQQLQSVLLLHVHASCRCAPMLAAATAHACTQLV
jgi:hypothetical protein